MTDGIVVEQVRVEITLPLRREVLRPHESLAQLRLPGDDDPATAHFAAYDGAGDVVGTASVRLEAPPESDRPDRDQPGPGWRLRGMATRADLRGRGVGGLVLTRVVDHVARLGGGLLWCDARTPAVEFYRRAGFRTRGEPWDDPAIGPHVRMDRWVAPR